MPPRLIQFQSIDVSCSEAMDYEIVQVTFDSVKDDPDADYRERASPYLLLSVNFEFEDDDEVPEDVNEAQECANGVQLEFHDGQTDDGGYSVTEIKLWRDRVRVVAEGGPEFDIGFELSKTAFTRLRRFLKILFRSDCFQERETVERDRKIQGQEVRILANAPTPLAR